MSQPAQPGNPFELIERRSGGALGVAAIHVEKGRMIGWRHDQFFPMGPVANLPVAVRALSQAERGFFPWRKMVKIEPDQMRPGHSPLRERYPDGAIVTLGQLIEAIIVDSDETASSVLLAGTGGTEPLQEALDYYGFAEIHGISDATPQALARLASAIQAGPFMKERTRATLTKWLTGPIPGIPSGTPCWRFLSPAAVAGLVTLPGDNGHFAFSVLTRDAPPEQAARAVAESVRFAYAFWSSR